MADLINKLKWIKTYGTRIDVLRTLCLNFKKLPFKQAIHIPIILGKGIRLKNISGNIIIDSERVYSGMVTYGIYNTVVDHNSYIGILDIVGTLIIKGMVTFHTGVKIVVRKNAVLIFNGENTIGHSTLVCCAKKILLGIYSTVSWNCQIYDTNFHFFMDISKKTVKPRNSQVIIGNYVFCGNGSNITKGAIIPDGCVISNFSVVNKDFTSDGTNLLLAGNPAKIIKKGYKFIIGNTIRDNKPEQEYAKILD